MVRPGARMLRSVQPCAGGLLVPADVPSRAADLTFTADGLRVAHGDVVHEVPWDRPDVQFCGWERTKLSTIGVALDDAVAADALRATWTALLSRGRFGHQRRTVPIIIEQGGPEAVELFAVLLDFLRSRPDARPSLRNPERVGRLADDLVGWRLQRPGRVHTDPWRGDRIRGALGAAGYLHPTGRPLPPWVPDPPEVILDRVRSEVSAIPDIEYRMLSERLVRKVIEVEYLGPEPWPFAALVD